MTQNKRPEILILELLDRRASDMVLEGSEESGMPIVLDGPGARKIISTSHVVDAKGEYREIRYIKGAKSIYVDEQEKANVKPHPSRDEIWFRGTSMTVVNAAPDKNLYEYLLNCAYNLNAPRRPDHYPAVFKTIDTAKVSENTLDQMILQSEAVQLVTGLRERTSTGYEYDTEKIGFLCTLFNIEPMDDDADRMRALLSIAQAEPMKFLNTMADRTKEIRIDVLSARKFNVLSIDNDQASLTKTGANFYDFESTSENERVDELVYYFLSQIGEKYYNEMLLELRDAKRTMLESE